MRFSGIGIYLLVGISIFVITEKLVYRDINTENYRRIFAGFLALSGVTLLLRSI